MDGAAPLSCTFQGRMCRLVIDRRPVNALTPRTVRQLYEAVSRLADRTDIQLMVLTGAGGPGHGFCPGADIRFRGSAEAAAEAAADGVADAPLQQLSRMIRELPMVTVAAINGAVAGAGLGLALACDLRVAARSAKFATAFLARGLSGDMGVWWNLVHLVGLSRARELGMLVDKLTADDALRHGLVAEVWDDDEWASRLDALTARLLGIPHAALLACKANLLDAETMDLARYLEVEIRRHRALSGGAESVALFERFLDSRTT